MLKSLAACLILALNVGVGSAAVAQCVGTCGSAGPDGDITSPPEFGPNYSYITTLNGVSGAGQITGVGGTTGSEFLTTSFSANSGDALNFYFNYITSDGSTFADYAFAQLLTASLDPVAFLFTARTTPSGDTSPGFGLPANSATLTPASTPITANATNWSFLGSSSGACFAAGCGNTGWINSNYLLTDSGSYVLRLGVTNFSDSLFQSGLAFAGVTVAGVEIPTPTTPIPEPATWAMMLLGFGLVGGAMRSAKRRQNLSVSYA